MANSRQSEFVRSLGWDRSEGYYAGWIFEQKGRVMIVYDQQLYAFAVG